MPTLTVSDLFNRFRNTGSSTLGESTSSTTLNPNAETFVPKPRKDKKTKAKKTLSKLPRPVSLFISSFLRTSPSASLDESRFTRAFTKAFFVRRRTIKLLTDDDLQNLCKAIVSQLTPIVQAATTADPTHTCSSSFSNEIIIRRLASLENEFGRVIEKFEASKLRSCSALPTPARDQSLNLEFSTFMNHHFANELLSTSSVAPLSERDCLELFSESADHIAEPIFKKVAKSVPEDRIPYAIGARLYHDLRIQALYHDSYPPKLQQALLKARLFPTDLPEFEDSVDCDSCLRDRMSFVFEFDPRLYDVLTRYMADRPSRTNPLSLTAVWRSYFLRASPFNPCRPTRFSIYDDDDD
jgi:hypothetical protein